MSWKLKILLELLSFVPLTQWKWHDANITEWGAIVQRLMSLDINKCHYNWWQCDIHQWEPFIKWQMYTASTFSYLDISYLVLIFALCLSSSKKLLHSIYNLTQRVAVLKYCRVILLRAGIHIFTKFGVTHMHEYDNKYNGFCLEFNPYEEVYECIKYRNSRGEGEAEPSLVFCETTF